MLPWQVWETFPFRHIQRFYLLAVREMWRERYWYLRIHAPKAKEPAWLNEDLDDGTAPTRPKTSEDSFEKMKAYFLARDGGT